MLAVILRARRTRLVCWTRRPFLGPGALQGTVVVTDENVGDSPPSLAGAGKISPEDLRTATLFALGAAGAAAGSAAALLGSGGGQGLSGMSQSLGSMGSMTGGLAKSQGRQGAVGADGQPDFFGSGTAAPSGSVSPPKQSLTVGVPAARRQEAGASRGSAPPSNPSPSPSSSKGKVGSDGLPDFWA